MEDKVLATPGQRFLAYLIDVVALYVPIIVLGVIHYSLALLGYLVGLAYIFVRDALPFLNGQSIGKKLMKIRVVMEETGEPITGNYGASAMRVVSLMIPIFGIVDAIMVISKPNHRRYGDEWAKTTVVQELPQ
ncbi:MAG: RDD family protein [Bernardetiaceae bacterium]|jgi:uncharacterized RDD family membrane protein YckC|nr:RDD family protein [Bernardetiaceae bacterium]